MATFKVKGDVSVEVITTDIVDVSLDDDIVADSEYDARHQARAMAIKEAQSYGIMGSHSMGIQEFNVTITVIEATDEERARWEAEANEELMRKIGAPTLF